MSQRFRNSSVEQLVALFFDLVAALDVDLFVEAGAKEATASRRATACPTVNRVVAFEANPFTYRRFAEQVGSEGVEYVHLALATGPGEVVFHVRKSAAGDPMADGQGSIMVRPDYEPGYHEVVVESTSLDTYLSSDTAQRAALWVDVEGALEHVLQGAAQTLRRTTVMIVEVEDRSYWGPEQWLRSHVVGFVGHYGLVPIARDLQSRFQHNLLFVPESLVAHPDVEAAVGRWREALAQTRERM